MKPGTPKEKAERTARHGCVQAGHARIAKLRRERLIRHYSIRRAKGPAYSKYLDQARKRIVGAKHRRKLGIDRASGDPLFNQAVRRVHRRLSLAVLPVELALAIGGFFLIYWASRQVLMAAFLSFPLVLLVSTVFRRLILALFAPIDVLVRREYERLSESQEKD